MTLINISVTKDPEASNCYLVHVADALVRLVPSPPPMSGYYTFHFLEGNPSAFTRSGGAPWGTKAEMISLLQRATQLNDHNRCNPLP